MSKGKLYLIPTPIADGTLELALPSYNLDVIRSLEVFVAEELKTARRFLKMAGYEKPFDEVIFMELNEHTPPEEVERLAEPLLAGKNAGLLSEAGLPCVGDPGSELVSLAQRHHIEVLPLVGPSSVMLALMSSGMAGQRFSFHGYLPVEKQARMKKIRELETESLRTGMTQIFMEAPYRNNQLLAALLGTCHGETRLCIAADLTSPQQKIETRSISYWRKHLPDLHKRPAVFVLSA